MSAVEKKRGIRQAARGRAWATFQALLRTRVTAGLLLVLPIWITYLLVTFVIRLMSDASLWVVEAYLVSPYGVSVLKAWDVTPEQLQAGGLEVLPEHLRWGIFAFSVLLTIMLLYAIGLFTSNIIGRRLVQAAEALVDRVPFVKPVYRASKQVLETFAGSSAQGLQRVALIPFPTRDVRSVGFITSVLKDSNTGEELCTVFLATTPNPTSGFVFIVRRSDLIELAWTVEEAVKAIMSGGVLLPPGGVPFSQPAQGTKPAET